MSTLIKYSVQYMHPHPEHEKLMQIDYLYKGQRIWSDVFVKAEYADLFDEGESTWNEPECS